MKKRHMLNLQQKLIKISKKLPKLIKKHYSDEVDYDFVKIDDIYEIINPAFAKYHICIQEMEEKDSKTEFKDGRWLYTSELYFCLVNADQPAEREPVHIHLVGDHEDSPAKAQGAAWTYGLKHFLLYKFQIKQVSEDPDMRGKPAGGTAKRSEVPKGSREVRDAQNRRQEEASQKVYQKTPSDVVGKSPLYGRLASDLKNGKREEAVLPGNRRSTASGMVTTEPDPAKIFGSGAPNVATPVKSEVTGPVKSEAAGPAKNEAAAPVTAGDLKKEEKDMGIGQKAEANSGGEEVYTSRSTSGNGQVIPMSSTAKVVQGKFGSREETAPTDREAADRHFDDSVNPEQEEAVQETVEHPESQERESGSKEAESVPGEPEEKAGKAAETERQEEVTSDPVEEAEALPAEESQELSEKPHPEFEEKKEGQQTMVKSCEDEEKPSSAETVSDAGEEESEKAAEQAPAGHRDEGREEGKPAVQGTVHSHRRERRSRKNKKNGGDEAEQMSLLDFAQSRTGASKEPNPDSPAGDPEGEKAAETASETSIKDGNTAKTAGPEEKVTGDMETIPESIEETEKDGTAEETDGFVEAEEIPFEEADEEDFFKELEMEIRDEEEKPLTMEEALQTICPYALFEGKTFAEMLEVEAGRKQLAWFATEYMGSDFRVRDAAKLIMEDLEQKAA